MTPACREVQGGDDQHHRERLGRACQMQSVWRRSSAIARSAECRVSEQARTSSAHCGRHRRDEFVGGRGRAATATNSKWLASGRAPHGANARAASDPDSRSGSPAPIFGVDRAVDGTIRERVYLGILSNSTASVTRKPGATASVTASAARWQVRKKGRYTTAASLRGDQSNFPAQCGRNVRLRWRDAVRERTGAHPRSKFGC